MKREPALRALRPPCLHREEIRHDAEPRRRPAAGLPGRRYRQDAGAGAAAFGGALRRSTEERRAGNDRRPGHVPLNQIETNILLEKRVCKGAPFYVLGPIVTDIAPGYDHITAAIGGALAGFHGADFICYVTPSEHLGLPTIADVREGVIVARIAAHAADLARGRSDAWERNRQMSIYRKALDWEGQIRLAIDPTEDHRFQEREKPPRRRLQHVRRILRHEDRLGVFQEVDGDTPWNCPSMSSPFPSLRSRIRDCIYREFRDVIVEGEISNFKIYPSGHLYFTLKDDSLQHESGHVQLRREIPRTIYQGRDGGHLQGADRPLREKRRIPPPRGGDRGERPGLLQIKFEMLKEKLFNEGLFDAAKKRPAPPAPPADRDRHVSRGSGHPRISCKIILRQIRERAGVHIPRPCPGRTGLRGGRLCHRAFQPGGRRRRDHTRAGEADRWKTSPASTRKRWRGRSMPQPDSDRIGRGPRDRLHHRRFVADVQGADAHGRRGHGRAGQAGDWPLRFNPCASGSSALWPSGLHGRGSSLRDAAALKEQRAILLHHKMYLDELSNSLQTRVFGGL